MAILVAPLVALRTQLNEAAPNRDKTTDGWIGDYAHSQETSGHNPDDTSQDNAEWDGDPDSIQEVRAIDIDADIKDFTAADLVRHLLKYCRNGTFWWIRYIIFDGVIYHKYHGNYEAREYTGSNKHTKHIHISNDWTQSADNKSDANYRFEEIPVALTAADKEWIADQIPTASEVAKAVVTEMRNSKLALSDTNMNELEAVITKAILTDKVPVTPFPFVADRMGQ